MCHFIPIFNMACCRYSHHVHQIQGPWWRPGCDDLQTIISDLAETGSTPFSGGLFWRQPIWWWRADYFYRQQIIWDLAGTGTTLFSGGLFWDQFFSDLRIFFGACFRSKLMYYNLYHVSDLRETVRFLHKIECIEFECNKFVLVLVKIDLIQFEYSNCISSTWTKTNTNSLHSNSIHSILSKIGHRIHIVVHQFVCKTSAKNNS